MSRRKVCFDIRSCPQYNPVKRKTMIDPKIYLSVDNCFASKRWTKPEEWAELIAGFGGRSIEVSADNECDPLYSDSAYLKEWVMAVKKACRRHNVTIATLYSGHGTYSTLGLGHFDTRCRDRIQNEWIGRMIENAADLEAGLGFFCHAFPQSILDEPRLYTAAKEDLFRRFSEIAVTASKAGLRSIGVEQMYSPHQIPWTIDGAMELLSRVFVQSGVPFYITIDTGHQVGQKKFLRPHFREREGEGDYSSGSQAGVDQPVGTQAVTEQSPNSHPHLFAEEKDGDLYRWLEALGCYSPIIHLQQTDGTSSAHLPFTEEANKSGIVDPVKLLRALHASYGVMEDEEGTPGTKASSSGSATRRGAAGPSNSPAIRKSAAPASVSTSRKSAAPADTPEARRGLAAPGNMPMPQKTDHIYLTLEIFAGTSEKPKEILTKIEESVRYWRRYVPQDGLRLSELIKKEKQERHMQKSPFYPV